MDQTGGREDSQDPFTNSKKDSKPKRKHLTEDKFTFDEKKEHIKDHLRLLAQDDAGFLRLCGQGEWTVDFEWLADFSRDVEVNSYIRENFGSEGHRIVKILRKFGKLEDKGLPHLALMTPKNLRTTLARMQMAGMVDIQAVPRDAGHTNARTIFLWHFDVERITEILLDKVYKAMSRHLQRLEIERRKASGIISLSQRADVVAGKSALNAYQMGLLTEYRQLEAKFTIQLMRLDGLVGIFRDF
jgi:DNA-directed RNA polymerase III subunit RPC3